MSTRVYSTCESFFCFKGSGAHRDLPSSPPRPSPDPAATAIATAASLIGLTSATAAPAAAPGAAVTFTSQPATAQLVAHYTVSPTAGANVAPASARSEEHTSELQSRLHLVCRLLLENK